MVIKMTEQKTSKFRSVLSTIYGEPHGITVIKGDWKTGKTNFGIKLFEILKEMKLIHEAAGNIKIFKDESCEVPVSDPVKYIDNFVMLKAWMFRNLHRKIFFFDEAMKMAPSKRAMTRLNAEWQTVIPELSKGKVHLIALTQEESMTEKIFKHKTFNVATWTKIRLPPSHFQYRKRVKVSSKLLNETYIFNNISLCKTIYNPYLSATWSMEPQNVDDLFESSVELKVALAYSQGMSTDKIKSLFPEIKDRKEATRSIRKALKILFSKWQVAEVSSGDIAEEGCHN